MCEYAYERLIIRLASSLADQQLGLHALTVEDLGSIPGWGTKIPQAIQSSQKKESNYRVLSSNNKDYTILRCQAQPNWFFKCGGRMKTFSHRWVPKSWSQQLLQTAHRPKQVRECQRQGGGQSPREAACRPGNKALGWSTVARAAEPTRLRGKKLN